MKLSVLLLTVTAAAAIVLALALVAPGFVTRSASSPAPTDLAPPRSWATDPAWNAGPAEWALYDATRPIYGVPRAYDATIFTNVQLMDRETGVKTDDRAGAVRVFKHNVSEIIPTEHYAYRFLTTSFVEADSLAPSKVVVCTQEDCGSTYKQFVVGPSAIDARSYCYFPDAGAKEETIVRPHALAFHDALSLTLRDYPFDAAEKPAIALDLVADQTDTHETKMAPSSATVRYAGRETLTVPYGELDAHELEVTHGLAGGSETTRYWFAADPSMRHVMVKYVGPYGVVYELKDLGWWAYWDRDAVVDRGE